MDDEQTVIDAVYDQTMSGGMIWFWVSKNFIDDGNNNWSSHSTWTTEDSRFILKHHQYGSYRYPEEDYDDVELTYNYIAQQFPVNGRVGKLISLVNDTAGDKKKLAIRKAMIDLGIDTEGDDNGNSC